MIEVVTHALIGVFAFIGVIASAAVLIAWLGER